MSDGPFRVLSPFSFSVVLFWEVEAHRKTWFVTFEARYYQVNWKLETLYERFLVFLQGPRRNLFFPLNFVHSRGCQLQHFMVTVS